MNAFRVAALQELARAQADEASARGRQDYWRRLAEMPGTPTIDARGGIVPEPDEPGAAAAAAARTSEAPMESRDPRLGEVIRELAGQARQLEGFRETLKILVNTIEFALIERRALRS